MLLLSYLNVHELNAWKFEIPREGMISLTFRNVGRYRHRENLKSERVSDFGSKTVSNPGEIKVEVEGIEGGVRDIKEEAGVTKKEAEDVKEELEDIKWELEDIKKEEELESDLL